MTVSCEWTDCTSPGTHHVEVDYSDGRSESRLLCRKHDAEFKNQVRDSIPPKAAQAQPDNTSVTVTCGDCGLEIDEAPALPVEQRQKCPNCHSLKRQYQVVMSVTVQGRASLGLKVRATGVAGWARRMTSGDNFHHSHDAWGERILDIDRGSNRYREAIIFRDGTALESTAKLTDHQ